MKYQYATLSSNLPENSLSEFIHETDTLTITYSFNGENCPVRISIKNKLDEPLYVDWKRSAITFKDQTYSYWKDRAILNVTAHGSEIQWTPYASTTNAIVTGEITRDEAISFIPPHATKQTSMLTLTREFLDLSKPREPYHAMVTTQTGPVAALEYEYSQENSPFKYRSFLTLSADPSFARPLTCEHEFWVSEVMETQAKPNSLEGKKSANQFYAKKSTGFGGVLVLAGVIVLAVLSVR